MLPVPELNEHILAMELRADKKVEDPDLGLRLRGGTVSHASKMNNSLFQFVVSGGDLRVESAGVREHNEPRLSFLCGLCMVSSADSP